MTDAGFPAERAIAHAHRDEWAQVVAGLARRFGDLDLAEDAASEAFVVAVERWPRDGVPPNPGAWLTTTAARKAIDRLRRESRRDDKYQAAWMLTGDAPPEPVGAVEDDRLRLVFTCCHPALPMHARVALTLRLLGGLTVAEIAHAFLVPETTMAPRITRAKAKIRSAHIPYRVPSATDIRERLDSVLAVVYLIFNEGYLATAGEPRAAVSPTKAGKQESRPFADDLACLYPMRAITYAGETVVTTDEVATMLVQLTAALARDGLAEAVDIPIVPPDGEQTASAALVVGLGNDVLSIPQPWDGAEPDFSAQSGSLQKHHARYVPSRSNSEDDAADVAADTDLDFDFDLRGR